MLVIVVEIDVLVMLFEAGGMSAAIRMGEGKGEESMGLEQE